MPMEREKIKLDSILLGRIGFDRLEFFINYDDVDFSGYKHIKNEKMGTSSIDESDYIKEKQFKWRLYNGRRNGMDVLRLDIVLPRVFYDTNHNIYNVAAKKDTKEALKKVLNAIKEIGIDIPMKSLKCKKIEINKTIFLDEDLRDKNNKNIFKRIFCSLVSSNPEDVPTNPAGGLTVYKAIDEDRKSIKFYDKTSEIENTLKVEIIESQLCRFEITLKGEGIMRAFKTLDITKITQPNINKIFKAEINDLEKNLEDYILNASNELYQRFKSKEEIKERELTLGELRTTYQAYDTERTVIYSEIVENAVKKYRPNYTRNMDTVREIIGSESISRFMNYKTAKNLLKKLKKNK